MPNLVSFFGYGLSNWTELEREGNLFQRPHYYAPAELQARIDHTVLGTLNATGWHPDLLWFSSGMWDSASRHFADELTAQRCTLPRWTQRLPATWTSSTRRIEAPVG